MINQQRIIKNSRKVKAMDNITTNMDHYPVNGQVGDTNIQSDISY